MMLNYEKTGKLICKIRNKMHLSQQELADRVGNLSKGTISKWENGRGFPEVSYIADLCNVLDITMEELFEGKYNYHKRFKDKFCKILLIILLCILPFLIIALLFFSVYFVFHYNTTKIYQISTNSKSSNEINIKVYGTIFSSYDRNTLYIGNIEINNYIPKNNDLISVDLYSKNRKIYHTNSLNSIVINYSKDDKIDINNLKLIILINNDNSNEIKYEVKLDISEDKKYYYQVKDFNDINTDENKIIKNLEKNGFKYTKDNSWVKYTTGTRINFLLDTATINYYESKNKIIKNIIYYYDNNSIEVYIYHDNDIHTVIEKYVYYLNNNKLICENGECSTINEVLKIMKKYISLFNVD